mgnify:CR=1 FL=1
MNELVWMFFGFCFGIVFMLNRKEYKEQKTYEQLDEEMRKELALFTDPLILEFFCLKYYVFFRDYILQSI